MPGTVKPRVAGLATGAATRGGEREAAAVRIISPLEGEMSPKAAEGVGATGCDFLAANGGRHLVILPAIFPEGGDQRFGLLPNHQRHKQGRTWQPALVFRKKFAG
ncbi:hypothetical protein EB230_04800 [Mesorhizobium sp. NZP2234]|nr:hypothetical protein EB230_04800 [Mesorhizobium sp. NZP2234]